MNWIAANVDRFTQWVMARLGVVPTTQLLVVSFVGMALATGFVYLMLAIKVVVFDLRDPITLPNAAAYVARQFWTPSIEWLAFLNVGLGGSTAHFFLKRKTYDPAKAAAANKTPPKAPEP